MLKLCNILCFLAFTIIGSSDDAESSFLVFEEKSFAVEGFSSIGGFVCKCEFQGKDTIFLGSKDNKILYRIPIDGFECGNLLFNKNFKKTLKSEFYPNAEFSISDLKYFGTEDYVCKAELRIVGKRICFPHFILKKKSTELLGEVELKMTDLGLECASYMGGLVKVKDKVFLKIGFKMQQIQKNKTINLQIRQENINFATS